MCDQVVGWRQTKSDQQAIERAAFVRKDVVTFHDACDFRAASPSGYCAYDQSKKGLPPLKDD